MKPPRKVVLKKKEVVFDDIFKIQRALLQFEKFDGTLSAEVQRLNFDRGHSAAILLYDPAKNEFVFVEQFRYPAYANDEDNGWTLEIIAGIVEQGETPLEVVKREAIEETGYEATEVEYLCEFYPSPGGSSECIFVFFGILGEKVSAGGGLANEAEDTLLVGIPAKQVYDKLEKGFFKDAKTLIAIQYIKERIMKHAEG